MKKSALQTARASYQPKLPEAIKNGVTIVEGKATQSVADQEAIAKLFPNTYGMPVLRFEAAAKKEYPAINVGVILSGGQAPGGHNVISGLFDGLKALNKESRLFGFLLGPGGLIEHKWNLRPILSMTTAIRADSTLSVRDVPNWKRRINSTVVSKLLKSWESKLSLLSVATIPIPTLAYSPNIINKLEPEFR